MKRLAAALILLLPAGCDDFGHVVINRGEVCVDREQVLDFKQTGELALQVRMDCESRCIENEETFCEASIDGPTIRLESQFVWSETDEQDCSLKCEELAARCVLPETYPGTYTLVHGQDQYTIELPSNPLIDCLAPMDAEDPASE